MTIPQALKNFNQKKASTFKDSGLKIVNRVNAFIEIDKYIRNFRIEKSKRTIQKILRLEEL